MKKLRVISLALVLSLSVGCVGKLAPKHVTTVADRTALTASGAADDLEMAAFKEGRIKPQDHHNFSVEMVKVYKAEIDIAAFARTIPAGQPMDLVKAAALYDALVRAVTSTLATLPANVGGPIQEKLNTAVGLAGKLVGR